MDFTTDNLRQFIHLNRKILLAQEYRESEGIVIAKDGRHAPVLIHDNTLRSDQGHIIGNMAFVTDMPEYKKALALAGEVQKSLQSPEKSSVKGLDIAR